MRVLLYALLAWLSLGAVVAHAAGPASKRSTPSRNTAFGTTTSINGIEYISAKEFARTFGYAASANKAGNELTLKLAHRVIELRVNSRECSVDGLRVMLGEAVRIQKSTTYISRIDAETFLAPMLRPGHGQAKIPGLKTIVLDPGHGGVDSGKVNEKLKVQEKVVALDLALRLEKLLKARGYTVILTRRKDKALELADRPEVADKAKADLFLSLHFNAAPQDITGIEVFTMTPRHQFSTDDPDRSAGDIHILNLGNAHDHWNSVLAHAIHKNLLADLKAPDRGIKRQRWAVLRLAPCPAVLIESGYLSNNGEAKKIGTPAYRQAIAEAIADGVDTYASALKAAAKK